MLPRLGIIGLVIIAVVLGYTIYQQQIAPSSNNQSVSTNQQSIENKNASQNQQDTQQTTQNTTQSLTPKDMLSRFPADNASEAERNVFFDNIRKLGQEVELVSINNCNPTPVILRVKQGRTFTFRNEGDTDAGLSLKGKSYLIEPKGTLDLKPDWGGVTSYSCGTTAAGIISIE